VNDHHNHQLHRLHKQSSENLLLLLYHHDQSSLSVFQLLQPDHVISSSNVGFLMVLLPNEKPLFKELRQPKLMLHHVTLLSNTNKFKFVLSDNSNVWVLLKQIHKLTFNNTEHNYLMLKVFSNKPVLLVLLKISRHQLLLEETSVHHHSAKNHHSVLVVVLVVVLVLVELNLLVPLVENSVVLQDHTHPAASKALPVD